MRPDQAVTAKLVDFQAWSKTGAVEDAISLLDYVGFVATPDLFFGFASLFWPDLVVHDGLHFLASGFSSEIYEQWLRAGKTPRDVQRIMNHVHVSSLLQSQVVSDEVAVEVARSIASMWSRTIGPDGIVAEFSGQGLDDAEATFFTVSTQAASLPP